MRRLTKIVLGAIAAPIVLGSAALGLASLLNVGYPGPAKDSSDGVRVTLEYVRKNAKPFPAAVTDPMLKALQDHYELRSVPLPQEVQGNERRTQLFSNEILTGLGREYDCQAMIKPGFDERGATSNGYVTIAYYKSSCKEAVPPSITTGI
ncbi:MAG: hypothetical protein AABX70_07190 [Nanoarchaeota archaeon]